MRRTMLVLVVGLLLAADAPNKDQVKKELQNFAGKWKAVSMERDGKPVPQEQVEKISLEVKGNQYTFHIGDQVILGTHKLDPTKTPKHIDAVRSAGPHEGEVLKGIYTLEGDTYKVCFGEPGGARPTEFSTTSGGGHRLLVMKRVKP